MTKTMVFRQSIRSFLCPVAIVLLQTSLGGQTAKFLYASRDGGVSGYTVDANTGSVTQIPGSPFPGPVSSSIAVDPTGEFLYAPTGPSDTILAYTINRATGVLTTVPGTFQSIGYPIAVAAHPSGKFLYSAGFTCACVRGFRIDALTGALTPVPGSALGAGSGGLFSIVVHPNGRFGYAVNRFGSTLLGFAIDPITGSISSLPGSPTSVVGVGNAAQVTLDPTGRFAYVAAWSNVVAGFSVDLLTGALTQFPGSPIPTGGDMPTSVTADPTGRFLYVSNQNSKNISGYTINPINGVLSSIAGSPFPAANGLANSVTVEPSGRFAYAGTGRGAVAYGIDSATGALNFIAGSPFPPALELRGIATTSATDPAGTLLRQVTPDHGGNAGTLTALIVGSGFVAGTEVILRASGQPDIAGLNTSLQSSRILTSTFDLRGAVPGIRHTVLVNAGIGTVVATLVGSFTIEAGGAAQLSIDFIGRSALRGGAAQVYDLVLENKGNINGGPEVISLGVPKPLSVEFLSNTPLLDSIDTTELTILSFGVPSVSPGHTQTIPIRLLAPDDLAIAHRKLRIRIQQRSLSELTNIVSTPIRLVSKALNTTGLAAASVLPGTNVLVFGPGVYDKCQPALKAPCPQCDNKWDNIMIVENSTSAAALNYELARLDFIIAALQALTDVSQIGSLGPSGTWQVVSGNRANIITLLWNLGSAQSLLTRIANLYTAMSLARNNLDNLNNLLCGAVDSYLECVNSFCSGGRRVPPSVPVDDADLDVEIVTSSDPNDKVGKPGAGGAHYLSDAQPLNYSIYFDNLPTATASAQKVVVTDQLNTAAVDISTLTLGPISFIDKLITPPLGPLATLGTFSTDVDLRPAKSLIVRISAALNQATGVLTWTYLSLDPVTGQPTTDPLAGFLPPGTEGSVSFNVQPKSASTGTQITNKAMIVFDVNPPIDTPVWLNTIDASKPTSHIVALAATQTTPTFTVQWSGADTGAGIRDYSVYVSDNGGPFMLWQRNTAASSAPYNGAVGHTYGFYSIARDLVGNTEPAKTAAEGTTTVIQQSVCAIDVTAQFTIVRSGFRLDNATKHFLQTVTLTRNSTAPPLTAPFALALDVLTSNATLFSPVGTTACSLPAGSPFLVLGPGSTWAAGQSVTANLEFLNPTNAGITYTPRVLAGGPNR